MASVIPQEIEDYAYDYSSPEGQLYKELAKNTFDHCDMAVMQVGHVEGSFLRMLVQLTKARRVLEIGTFTGYSALAMAEGLGDDGELIACDIDADTAKMAREHWDKSPHGKKIQLRIGPALETIEQLQGPFDFVFIDADKENYLNYWEYCLPKVSSGGVLLVDNVFMGTQVLDPQDSMSQSVADFNNFVRDDQRVELVMLTIRDGITLARKK
jgi:caffeoyl-CoA O-methyltransferase